MASVPLLPPTMQFYERPRKGNLLICKDVLNLYAEQNVRHFTKHDANRFWKRIEPLWTGLSE